MSTISMRGHRIITSSGFVFATNACRKTTNNVICGNVFPRCLWNACSWRRASAVPVVAVAGQTMKKANQLYHTRSAFKHQSTGHPHGSSDHYNDVRAVAERDESLEPTEPNKVQLIDLDDEFVDESFRETDPLDADDVEIRPHRQRAQFYNLKIKELTRANRLDEALRFFDIRMKKEDKIPPSYYVYFRLITACGAAGYLDRAFELFNEMKSRHYIGAVRDARVISSLFNACAECPFPEKALAKTKYFYERLSNEKFSFDVTNYNAIMKAFARHGDIVSAFGVVDRMELEGLSRDVVTVQTLLSACLSDKHTGFKFAIEVWRYASKRQSFRFDNLHYQILLRIVRECGVGSDAFAQDLISNKSKKSLAQLNAPPQTHSRDDFLSVIATGKDAAPRKSSKSDAGQNELQAIAHAVDDKSSLLTVENHEFLTELTAHSSTSSDVQDDDGKVRIPDILRSRLRYDATLRLNSLSTPTERLSLLGGPEGILHRMQIAGLQPDPVIFGELIQCLDSTNEAEHALISLAHEHHIPLDVSFFNLLLSKRVKRRDAASARDAVHMMHQSFITPNEQTFGCLALLCQTETDARQFLSDMEKCDIKLNTVMLAPMLGHALRHARFGYAVMIMELFLTHIGYVTPVAVRNLEGFFDKHLRVINKFENMPPSERRRAYAEEAKQHGRTTSLYENEAFLQNVYRFKQYYFLWLKRVQSELPEHPWKRFQQHLDVAADGSNGETDEFVKLKNVKSL